MLKKVETLLNQNIKNASGISIAVLIVFVSVNIIPITSHGNSVIGSVKAQGYAELVSASNGVAGWLARDKVIKEINISDPEAPSVTTTIDTPNFAESAYEDSKYLYVADNKKLRIMSLSDLSGDPVGTYTFSQLGENFWPATILVQGVYAYISSGSEQAIINVSDPSQPSLSSTFSVTGSGYSYLYLRNEYLYITNSIGGMSIVNVSDPQNPSTESTIAFESETMGIKGNGNYLYLSRIVSTTPTSTGMGFTATSRFEVYDLSSPSSPTVIGSTTIPTNVKGLYIQGDYAYAIGSYPYLINPIDISSPSNPSLKSTNTLSFPIGQELRDIIVLNGYAFIADGNAGFRVVDVSDLTNQSHVIDLDLQGSAEELIYSENTMYVVVDKKIFHVADVSNPSQPVLTSSILFTKSYNYTSIVLRDNKAFFNGSSMQSYDISDPYSIQKITQEAVGVDGFAIRGDYLYTVIGEWGLDVYDISSLAAPILISRTNFPKGNPRDLALDSNWVVALTNIPYTITLIDISDPVKPVVKDSYKFESYPMNATVKDGYVYVARGNDGLDIFKITNNGSLQNVANYKDNDRINNVEVAGNRAFLSKSGVGILDVSNQTNPTDLGYVKTNGDNNKIAVSDGYLYIADGHAGLTVVSLEHFPNIKVNGFETSVSIQSSDTLSASVNYNSTSTSNTNVDLWVVASTPTGIMSYKVSQGWVSGLTVAYQGRVGSFDDVEIFRESNLRSGNYIYYFGLDFTMNGRVDFGAGSLLYDTIQVSIE